MVGIVRAALQNRNNEVLEEWYSGLSQHEIKQKYGLSQTGLRRLVRQDKLHNGPRDRVEPAKANSKLEGRKPLSALHAHIGFLISRHLDKQKMSPTIFGMQDGVGFTRYQVRAMTLGVYDLKITELEALATVLGVSFLDLVKGNKEAALAH
jgi:hypothetical protein